MEGKGQVLEWLPHPSRAAATLYEMGMYIPMRVQFTLSDSEHRPFSFCILSFNHVATERIWDNRAFEK